MPEHIWKDHRHGVRCGECGAVSREAHQLWPCEGRPEEEPGNQQIFGKTIGGTPIGCDGGPHIDPITQGWIQAATYWWRLYYILKDGKEPPITLAIDKEFLRQVKERDAELTRLRAIVQVTREAMGQREADYAARKDGGLADHNALNTIARCLRVDAEAKEAAEKGCKATEAPPNCETCGDTGHTMAMVCYGGVPHEAMQPCPDCNRTAEKGAQGR